MAAAKVTGLHPALYQGHIEVKISFACLIFECGPGEVGALVMCKKATKEKKDCSATHANDMIM